VPKEELSRRARQEAEKALQMEADMARERAKKSSDMVPKLSSGPLPPDIGSDRHAPRLRTHWMMRCRPAAAD
jgi:hypothetical protein